MNEFKDKVAIVTGAATGMGKVIARRLATVGIHVVMADISANIDSAFEELKAEFNDNKGFAVRVDVTKSSEVEALVEKTVQQLGKLDIMVNNAGIVQDMLPVTETPEEVLDRILAVNLKGVFFGSKFAGKQMTKQGSGTIVNTGSYYGKTGYKYFASYCASKAAVIVFTQSLALELAPHNVTANSVCPGNMATEMHWKALRDEAVIQGITFEEMKQQVIDTIPVGRHGTGEDIAGAILYLASKGGSYVTGQALNVNGGVEFH